MQLPICAFLAWVSIALLCFTPKRMPVSDFVFSYGITFVITTLTFTLYDLDFHFVTIPKSPSNSFAIIIARLITIPLLIILTINSLQSTAQGRQWFRAALLWALLVCFDWFLDYIGVIVYRGSVLLHTLTAAAMYLVFIAVMWGLDFGYQQLKNEHSREYDNVR